jgi:hypothetical protein
VATLRAHARAGVGSVVGSQSIDFRPGSQVNEMKKFVLMSVLIATIWIPLAIAARSPDAREGMRRTQKQFLIFFAIWTVMVLYIVPRL